MSPHLSYNCQYVSLICALKRRLGQIFPALNLCSVSTRLLLGSERRGASNMVKALEHGHIELLADFIFSRGKSEKNKGFSIWLINGICM